MNRSGSSDFAFWDDFALVHVSMMLFPPLIFFFVRDREGAIKFGHSGVRNNFRGTECACNGIRSAQITIFGRVMSPQRLKIKELLAVVFKAWSESQLELPNCGCPFRFPSQENSPVVKCIDCLAMMNVS